MFKSPINPYPGFTKTQTPLQYSPNHPAPWWLTMRSKKLRFSTARNQWHKWDEFRQNIPATKWSDQWLGTVLSYGTALETSSLRLKIDGWNTILCFWGPAYFQVYVSFSKCKNWLEMEYIRMIPQLQSPFFSQTTGARIREKILRRTPMIGHS